MGFLQCMVVFDGTFHELDAIFDVIKWDNDI